MKYRIPVKPQAKERPRLGRRRRVYTPEKTMVFESAIKEWWTANNGPKITDNAYVYVEISKTYIDVEIIPIVGRTRPVGVLGDIDNHAKSILDGLNGVAWDDDKQVEGLFVRFHNETAPKKTVARTRKKVTK